MLQVRERMMTLKVPWNFSWILGMLLMLVQVREVVQ